MARQSVYLVSARRPAAPPPRPSGSTVHVWGARGVRACLVTLKSPYPHTITTCQPPSPVCLRHYPGTPAHDPHARAGAWLRCRRAAYRARLSAQGRTHTTQLRTLCTHSNPEFSRECEALSTRESSPAPWPRPHIQPCAGTTSVTPSFSAYSNRYQWGLCSRLTTFFHL